MILNYFVTSVSVFTNILNLNIEWPEVKKYRLWENYTDYMYYTLGTRITERYKVL